MDSCDHIFTVGFVGPHLPFGARSFPLTLFVENTRAPQVDGFTQSVSLLLGTSSLLLVGRINVTMLAGRLILFSQVMTAPLASFTQVVLSFTTFALAPCRM